MKTRDQDELTLQRRLKAVVIVLAILFLLLMVLVFAAAFMHHDVTVAPAISPIHRPLPQYLKQQIQAVNPARMVNEETNYAN